mmetsp:Transcript_13551/g.15199  ORF Transcript_13551/g.15199 Transcript_13551/m.15199 type:complete len:226 (-) Transcript_13551:68-745(-)|eukprot:CAMPEP_0205829514 /NCGR_PEP_ID=MMETSP0206-20130828/38366_1 /ASSEMBLY_ACC=CAM_ASM_000279 /TAXON_ID=36767 /ORGANISM="Euplotes focardii, Strain TN1" /LENGTH=225 /DNA_ID=CAMNT_0053132303 /DNA_START=18 /DNA_END=695 /DNA_ORIENTATION=+
MANLNLYVISGSSNSFPVTALVGLGNKANITIKPLDPTKGETRTPEFLAKNPFHITPTLEDEEQKFVMWESSAILRFLAASSDVETMYPAADAYARAKIDQALDYRQVAFYPKVQDACYPLLGFRKAFPEGDEGVAAKEAANAALEATLKEFEAHYIAGGKFVNDSALPTIADLHIAAAIVMIGITSITLSKGVEAYMARVGAAVSTWAEATAPLEGYIKMKQSA